MQRLTKMLLQTFDWIWFGPYCRTRKLKREYPELYRFLYPEQET